MAVEHVTIRHFGQDEVITQVVIPAMRSYVKDQKTLFDNLCEQKRSLQSIIAKLEEECNKLKSDHARWDAVTQTLAKERDALKERADGLTKLVQRLEKKERRCIETVEGVRDRDASQLDELEGDVCRLRDRLDASQAERDRLRVSLEASEDHRRDAEALLRRSEASFGDAEAKAAAVVAEAEAIRRDAEDQLMKAQVKNVVLLAVQDSVEKENAALQAEEESVGKENARLTLAVQALQVVHGSLGETLRYFKGRAEHLQRWVEEPAAYHSYVDPVPGMPYYYYYHPLSCGAGMDWNAGS